MDDYVREEPQDANDALSDAEKLRQAGGTDEAIINRLYYACFHAVLHTRGFDSSTHKGAVREFGREVVMPGDATREDGRFFNNLQRDRDTADYDHKPLETDVDATFERAEMFVADMGNIV